MGRPVKGAFASRMGCCNGRIEGGDCSRLLSCNYIQQKLERLMGSRLSRKTYMARLVIHLREVLAIFWREGLSH